jgi:pyruvate/2-oxoacid:ferredoxin oxidoreductase beta subunit
MAEDRRLSPGVHYLQGAFDLCRLAQTAGATYVARWSTAHPRHRFRSEKRTHE